MLDYKYLYKKLNKRTPLKTDCGALCSNACCIDTDGEELGMYLFPYEEEMFLGKDNFKVEKTDLEYAGKKAAILVNLIAKEMKDRYPAEFFHCFLI